MTLFPMSILNKQSTICPSNVNQTNERNMNIQTLKKQVHDYEIKMFIYKSKIKTNMVRLKI